MIARHNPLNGHGERPPAAPVEKRYNRDSPDDSQTGVSIRVLRPCRKTDARCRRLPAPRLSVGAFAFDRLNWKPLRAIGTMSAFGTSRTNRPHRVLSPIGPTTDRKSTRLNS